MEQFKIKQDGFKEIRKAILIKSIPISLLAVCGGIAISHFNSNGQQSDVNVFPVLIPIMLGTLAFGLYRGIKRQKEIFESYRLISTKSSESILQKFQGLFSILTIGLMGAVYISKDKIIVGVSGTVLLVILGYSFIETQRSKNIDSKTKKGMWWLILVAASIVGVMYYKLMPAIGNDWLN